MAIKPPIKLGKVGERKFATPEEEKKVLELEKRAPIKLKQKPTFDIKEFREREGVVANLVKATTDWKTTVALLGTLGILTGGSTLIAGLAARGGTATLGIGLRGAGGISARTLTQIGKQVNVNAIGKAAGLTKKQTAALAVQVGRERITALARYAVNPKSMALTTKLLIGGGLTISAAGAALTILGSYPFAGFIKEEALQATNIPIQASLDAGDLEGAQMLLDQSNEILNMDTSQIPIKNILDNLKAYFKSQATANAEWQRLIDEKLKEAEGVGEIESPFEKSAREREERDIQTKADIKEGIKESEKRFKKRQKEIEAGVEARDEVERIKFENIRKENEERARLDTLFYEAIRKRNAGLELTAEERQILIDRGVSPEPLTSTETTFRRRSRVQF